MQLALMKPGISDIKMHVDSGGYAIIGHRIHVPLYTNPAVRFMQCPFKEITAPDGTVTKVQVGRG